MCYIDCLVAGAGPAGMAAAITLARAGASVVVAEKNKELKKGKACGGGLTPKAVKLINKLGFDAHLGQPVYYMEANTPPHHYNCFTLKKPGVYMTRRVHFDQSLREMALNLGVRFVFDRISSVSWDGRLFTLKTHCGKVFNSPRLIAADGAASRVRRAFEGRVCCQGLAIMADEIKDPFQKPVCLFDFGIIPYGYGWFFSYGDGRANAGVYSIANINGTQMRWYLAKYLKQRLDTEISGAITGRAIPWGGYSLPGRIPLLLAGDAGGFADPLTGEGIYAALRTGHLAAKAAIGKSPEKARAFYEKLSRSLLATNALLRLIFPRAYRYTKLGGFLFGLKPIYGPIIEGLNRGIDTSKVILAFPAFVPLSLASSRIVRFEGRSQQVSSKTEKKP